MKKINERLLRVLATEEALKYHITNYDKIENVVQKYEEDEEGDNFIEELCEMDRKFEMYHADEIVRSIEGMIDMLMEFYKYAERMRFETWTIGGNNESCCD